MKKEQRLIEPSRVGRKVRNKEYFVQQTDKNTET